MSRTQMCMSESSMRKASVCCCQRMCVHKLNGVVLLSVVRAQMQPANLMVSVFTIYCEIELKKKCKSNKLLNN